MITPLPLTLRAGDMVHSLSAPGGLRQIHIAPLPLSHPAFAPPLRPQQHHPRPQQHAAATVAAITARPGQYQVAVVTFVTAAGAREYKAYFDRHGFVLSTRQRDEDKTAAATAGAVTVVHGEAEPGGDGAGGSGAKRLLLVKRHLEDVQVRFWDDREDVEQCVRSWFALDDRWFCDLDAEIRLRGATRVLKVLGPVEPLITELDFCRFSRAGSLGGCVCPPPSSRSLVGPSWIDGR